MEFKKKIRIELVPSCGLQPALHKNAPVRKNSLMTVKQNSELKI